MTPLTHCTNSTMLHNLVVGTFPKEHARTVIETHFSSNFCWAAKREIGEGKMIGEDGGMQWGALLL